MLGKFDSELDGAIYQVSLDGPDHEFGESESGSGWYGLLVDIARADLERSANDGAFNLSEEDLDGAPYHAILNENSQGFVSVEFFDTAEEAETRFRDIEAEEDES